METVNICKTKPNETKAWFMPPFMPAGHEMDPAYYTAAEARTLPMKRTTCLALKACLHWHVDIKQRRDSAHVINMHRTSLASCFHRNVFILVKVDADTDFTKQLTTPQHVIIYNTRHTVIIKHPQHHNTVNASNFTDFKSDFESIGFSHFFTNPNLSDLQTHFLLDSDLIFVLVRFGL